LLSQAQADLTDAREYCVCRRAAALVPYPSPRTGAKLRQAKQKSTSASLETSRLRSEVQRQKGSSDDTSGELSAVTAELNDARRLVQSLRTEVTVLQRVNAELDTAKTEAYDKNDELAAALEEAQTQLLRLRSELTDTRGESTAARAEAVEAKTAVADETRELKDALTGVEAARDEAQQRAAEQKATIAQLQREMARVKSETRVAQLEDELNRAQSAVVGAGEENTELREQLERAEATIGDLVEKVQSVDELQREAAAAARADERASMAQQMAAMEGIHAELEAERTRYKEMQAQLGEEQVKAEDLRFRNEQYERRYGLSDLVGELDALRAENAKMAADLTAAGEELRERTDTVYTLTEIARRLARDTGKYPDDVNVFTIYDTGDLVAQHASLVEQYKADNAVLERQVEELQGERVRLMRELRVQARQTGEDGLFYFGLSSEQMRLVNEFAENLRNGKAVVPERDESAALRRQLEAVRRQMFEERAKFAEASLAFNAALQRGEVAGAPAAVPTHSTDLAEMLAEMREENARLRQELVALSDAQAERIKSLVSARSVALAPSVGIDDPDSDPVTARVIKLLRKAMAQEKGLRSKDVPNTLQSLLAAMAARRTALQRAEAAEVAEHAAAHGRKDAEGRADAASSRLSDVSASKAQLEGRVRGLQDDLADLRARLAELESKQEHGPLVPATPATPGFRSPMATSSHWGAGEVPMTPVGRTLLTRTLDTSHLPPLAGDWASEVASVHSALVASLEELVRREAAVSKLEGTLSRYDGSVATMSAQLVALYRAHIAGCAAWKHKAESAEAAVSSAEERVAAVQRKARMFDELVDVAAGKAPEEGTPARDALVKSLRSHVKRQARRLAELEAKLPSLQQELHVTRTQCTAADARKKETEAEVLQVHSVSQHRVLYLELWKRGAEARLARLNEVMTQWVPQSQADATAAALQELRVRHTVLLAEEASLRAEYITLRTQAHDASSTASHNQLLAAQLEEATAQAEHRAAQNADLRAALQQLGAGEGDGEGSPGELTRLSDAPKPSLLAEVARLRATTSDLTVRLDASMATSRVLQERVTELVTERSGEAAVAQAAEARAAAASAAREKALRETDALKSRFAGGLTGAEATALQDELTAMRERCEGLERETQRAAGMADIAADQATAATAMIKSREDEVTALKGHVAQLGAASSDNAIIGKLQAEIMAIKGSYAAFLRRYGTLRTAVHRLRVAAAAAETEADQRNAALVLALEEGRVKELALLGELRELRRIAAAQASEGDGPRVTMADVATLNQHVKELSSRLQETVTANEALNSRLRDGEDALVVERENVQCLEGAVQDVLSSLQAAGGAPVQAASSAAATPGTSQGLAEQARAAADAAGISASSTESREVVRRVIELHEKLRQSQLRGVRTQREVVRVRDELRLAVRRRGDAEEAVRALEDEVVALRSEVARSEEARRSALAQARAAKSSADDAAHSARMAAALAPDGSQEHRLVSATQAGQSQAAATSDVAAAQGEAAEYKRQATASKAAANKWRLSAAKYKKHAAASRARVKFLLRQLSLAGIERDELEAQGLPEEAGSGEESDGSVPGDSAAHGGKRGGKGSTQSNHGGGEDDDAGGHSVDTAGMSSQQIRGAYEAELRRLQAAAQHTVQQLRGLLDQKNTIIEGYAEKLESAQEAAARERQASAASAAAAADATHASQSESLKRLREAVDEIRTGAANTGMEAAQQRLASELGDRVDALQQQVILRDRRLVELDTQLTAMSGALEAAKERAAAAEAAASSASGRLATLQDETEGNQLARSVAQLRKALDGKERKIKSLHAALAALKDEFVKAEQEHAEANAAWRRDSDAAAARAEEAEGAVDKIRAHNASEGDVVALQRRVRALQGRVEAAQAAARAVEAARDESQQRVGAAERDSDAARDALQVHKAASERAWEEVKQLRVQVGDLQRARESDRARQQSRLAELVAQGGAPIDLGSAADHGVNGTAGDAVAKLRTRLSVLEAQNAALRAAQFEDAANGATAAPPAPPAPRVVLPPLAATGGHTTHEGDSDLASKLSAAKDLERKLRRRLEGVTARQQRQAADAEAAAAELASLRGAHEKLKSEKATLLRRVASLSKKQQRLDTATSAALAELEPVTALRARVVQLEEEAAQWKHAAQGQLAGEVRSAKAEAEGERRRANSALHEAEEARRRCAALGAQLKAVAGDSQEPDALLAEEAAFTEEASLREKLSAARREVAALESSLLSRDATLAELRYTTEEQGAQLHRMQRRVRELEALAALGSAAGVSGKGAHELDLTGGSSARDSAAAPGSRQGKLEHTITALKDVVNRQRREIDGMKARGTGASSGTSSATGAAAIQAGRELAAARAKVASLEEKVLGQQEQVAQLQGQLEEKAAQLRKAQAARKAAGERSTRAAAPGGDSAESQRLQDTLSKLDEENKALRSELAGLDMGFFEEVEDMKHQLALAQQKAQAFDEYMALSGQHMGGLRGSMQFSGAGDPGAASRRAMI